MDKSVVQIALIVGLTVLAGFGAHTQDVVTLEFVFVAILGLSLFTEK